MSFSCQGGEPKYEMSYPVLGTGSEMNFNLQPKTKMGLERWRFGTWCSCIFFWGVLPKIGVHQNGWFIMENPFKMDDLGVPLFLETPIFKGVIFKFTTTPAPAQWNFLHFIIASFQTVPQSLRGRNKETESERQVGGNIAKTMKACLSKKNDRIQKANTSLYTLLMVWHIYLQPLQLGNFFWNLPKIGCPPLTRVSNTTPNSACRSCAPGKLQLLEESRKSESLTVTFHHNHLSNRTFFLSLCFCFLKVSGCFCFRCFFPRGFVLLWQENPRFLYIFCSFLVVLRDFLNKRHPSFWDVFIEVVRSQPSTH